MNRTMIGIPSAPVRTMHLFGEGGEEIKVFVKLNIKMMRVIKFRAKRTDNNQWIIGNYIKIGEIAHGIKETFHSNTHTVIPETIGQFTGLNDENDTPIYEGDIVRYTMPDYEGEPVEYTEEVRFADGGFYVEGAPVYIIQGEPNGTIVGNIYENPELLAR